MKTYRTLLRITKVHNQGIIDVSIPAWSHDEIPLSLDTNIPVWLHPYLVENKRLHVKANLEAETPEELIESFHDWEMN